MPTQIRFDRDTMPVGDRPRGRERLTFFSVVVNVIYSCLVLASIAGSMVGLLTYSWVEASKEDMEDQKIAVSPNVPGFQSVSCGLVTYCIDAAGTVSECSIPWPSYGRCGLAIPCIFTFFEVFDLYDVQSV